MIGDPLVRNLGTIGGSAAYAHPSGDWGAALLAARATFLAAGPQGQRDIPADEFRNYLKFSDPTAPLLGISYRGSLGTLGWFDPMTLQPLRGRKVALADHTGSWAFSADRALLALGSWNAPDASSRT